MRTLKIFAAFGALLLVASGANASVTYTVSTGANVGAGQEMDVAITLTNAATEGADYAAFQFDWLLNGAAIPASDVQPGSIAPPGGVAGQTACTAGTAFQYQCNFTGAVSSGTSGSNTVGNGWLWSVNGALADGTFNLIGRFTFADTAAGNVSVGNCLTPSLNNPGV